MKKISLFLIIFSIVSLAIPKISNASFPDVQANHKNTVAINYLQEIGVLNGYPDGKFRPNNTVNRAEFLKIVIKGSNIETDVTDNTPFPDIDHNSWYGPYVKKAYAEGWIQGYQDRTFKPDQTINKVEALKILGKAQSWAIIPVTDPTPFIDTTEDSWYIPYVSYAKGHNLLEETGQNLNPGQNMTRAGISEIVYRTLTNNGEEGDNISDNTNSTDNNGNQSSGGSGGGGGSTNDNNGNSSSGSDSGSSDNNSNSGNNSSGGNNDSSSSGSNSNTGNTNNVSDNSDQPSPSTGATTITTLKVENDQPTARTELVYSGIPMSKGSGKAFYNTNNLYIADSSNRKVPAQFYVLSRWGGSPNDTSRPIRWLEVALLSQVSSNSSTTYTLGSDSSGNVTDSNSVSVTQTGNISTIKTGAAEFVLDSAVKGVIKTITYQNNVIYSDTVSGGPYVIGSNNQRINGTVESIKFEQTGPVKAVAKILGKFPNANPTGCTIPMYYEARMTFVRGSSEIQMGFDLENRCGDGGPAPFTKIYNINEAGWDFPFLFGADKKGYLANNSTVFASDVNFSGVSEIEQEKGRVISGNWRRNATMKRSGTNLSTAEYYEKPIAAISDSKFTAGITIPYFSWREPQALSTSNNTLTLKFVSDSTAIGEAQTHWNQALVQITGGNASNSTISNLANTMNLKIEKWMTARPPTSYTNSTKVMSRLPELTPANNTALKNYLNLITPVHNATVSQTGQKIYNKAIGSMIWPETVGAAADTEHVYDTPGSFTRYDTSLFWDASGVEYKTSWLSNDQLKTTGNGTSLTISRLITEFAFPALESGYKVIHYNTMRPEYNDRNGLPVGANGYGPGEWYRSEASPDDKPYTFMNSEDKFVTRPDYSLIDRVAVAGKTINERYIVGSTAYDYTQINITRGVIGFMQGLMNCAEFVKDEPTNLMCQNKLKQVMGEYTKRNLRLGVICDGYPSETASSCEISEAGLFHYSTQIEDFFQRYVNNWYDSQYTPTIKAAITRTGVEIYRTLMKLDSSGLVADDSNGNLRWGNNMSCTSTSCTIAASTEPMWNHTRAMNLSIVLRACELDPSINSKYGNMCKISAQSLPRLINDSALDDVYSVTFKDYTKQNSNTGVMVGWWKAAAMGMQRVINGIGIAETYLTPDELKAGVVTVVATAPDTTAPDTTAPGNTSGTGNTSGGGDTPPAEENPPTGNLPSSTYTLKSGESFVIDRTTGGGTFYVDPNIGDLTNDTCNATDFIMFSIYTAPTGSSNYTLIGNNESRSSGAFSDGSTYESYGCTKQRKIYTINSTSTHYYVGVCITNKQDQSQKICKTFAI